MTNSRWLYIPAAWALVNLHIAALNVPPSGKISPPVDDYLEGKIDLNLYESERPAVTFLLRVGGNSMKGAGVFLGDIDILDPSLVDSDSRLYLNDTLQFPNGEST